MKLNSISYRYCKTCKTHMRKKINVFFFSFIAVSVAIVCLVELSKHHILNKKFCNMKALDLANILFLNICNIKFI